MTTAIVTLNGRELALGKNYFLYENRIWGVATEVGNRWFVYYSSVNGNIDWDLPHRSDSSILPAHIRQSVGIWATSSYKDTMSISEFLEHLSAGV